MDENDAESYHLERLGGLGPKWTKIVPKAAIWNTWAAWARN
jgi:hypothetical protein